MLTRGLISLVLSLLLSACSDFCSNESAVSFARSLSQERLAQIALDVDSLDQKSYSKAKENIPPEFQDLHPQVIRRYGSSVAIYLSGSFDDKVVIFVHKSHDNGHKTIALAPGERNREIVLWESTVK